MVDVLVSIDTIPHFKRGGHNLWSILIRIRDWAAIKDMDTAEMPGTSLLLAIPAIRFLPGVDYKQSNNYIATPVREVI